MGGNGERYDPESMILCKRNSKSRKIGKGDRGEKTEGSGVDMWREWKKVTY